MKRWRACLYQISSRRTEAAWRCAARGLFFVKDEPTPQGGEKAVTIPYRIFAISLSALMLFAGVFPAPATGKVISEAHRVRHLCIDQCRSEATECSTKCKTGDCLEDCTEPLATCIDDCRAKYPREAK
jgi:hypothetical protein